MSYYNRFRGNYDHERSSLEERRLQLISSAQQHQPKDIDALLAAASEDDEVFCELEWVDVPNPWMPREGDVVRVRPVLALTAGYDDGVPPEDLQDKGIWNIALETRLPNGDTWHLGDMMFSHFEGTLRNEPLLTLNTSVPSAEAMPSKFIDWDSADAELFLVLAQGAFDAQPAPRT